MSEGFRREMYHNQKDTEELLDIWQKNDRGAWTDLAFAVIGQILAQRLAEVPPQGAFWDASAGADEEVEESANAPVFYQPGQVNRLALWIDRAALGVVILYTIQVVLSTSSMWYVFDTIGKGEMYTLSNGILQTLVMILGSGIITMAVLFFPLKALASILPILMAMEQRSRGVTISSPDVTQPTRR